MRNFMPYWRQKKGFPGALLDAAEVAALTPYWAA
jgi:hypothetical protein